jgi:DNA-binding protein Fis
MSEQPLKPQSLIIKPNNGITEQKKAELDALTLQVLAVQQDVEQSQAIVDSLTRKVADFQGFLDLAEKSRTQTYNNEILAGQLADSVSNLKDTSEMALSKMNIANDRIGQLSMAMKQVIDKLIYCASLVNKLANDLIRQKALNPLVSDELVSMAATAGKDANTAVALTLVALKSAFAAQISNQESAATMELEDQQAKDLYDMIVANPEEALSLEAILDQAYQYAAHRYQSVEMAVKVAETQLADAQATLNNAQVKLRSLQSGLSAANAAALAS